MGTYFCNLNTCILFKNVTPELLQLELCCCLSHQVSCHVCCGTIFHNNLASYLDCLNEMIIVSIYFDLCWFTGFLDREIAPWLSSTITTGPHISLSLNSWMTYKPTCTTLNGAMYSASQDDSATVDLQEIRGPSLFRLKQYPLVHHLSSVNDIAHSGECPSSTLKHVSLQSSVTQVG